VIGAAIEVHRKLGPWLDEPAYEEALEHGLLAKGFQVARQRGLPLIYKGLRLDAGYRLDLLVENRLPLEIKSVEAVHPVHEAQLRTYLRIGPFALGLLLNFNVKALRDGIQRISL
jgi:GxxExxY protein